MKLFNAIQLVTLLILSPLLLSYVKDAIFPFHNAVFYVGVIASAILYTWTIFMVSEHFERDGL